MTDDEGSFCCAIVAGKEPVPDTKHSTFYNMSSPELDFGNDECEYNDADTSDEETFQVPDSRGYWFV